MTTPTDSNIKIDARNIMHCTSEEKKDIQSKIRNIFYLLNK